MNQIRIIYDGECPFCTRYVRLTRLKENFQVELVDARSDPSLVSSYAEKGMDLNQGMVVDLGEQSYHGADAVWILSGLSSRSGIWNLLLAKAFGSRLRATLSYPLLRAGRRIALFLLGRKRL